MNYAFQLYPHANIKYTEALQKLAFAEMRCLLAALDLSVPLAYEVLGGTPFMSFTTDTALDPLKLAFLAAHSAVYLIAENEHALLRPLDVKRPDYLKPDIAEILKYKGKTNAAFTAMMLNCALSASDFTFPNDTITVLDPVCGKGTTLFCALQRGYHAVGIDIDRKGLKECSDYFIRYLQFHRIKHKRSDDALTLSKGQSAPRTVFSFSATAEDYKQQDMRQLTLICADTSKAPALLSKQPIHLLVGDLPYGVQHAPKESGRINDFTAFLKQVIPQWYQVLAKGGTMALSFNTFTVKKETLVSIAEDAGFSLPDIAYCQDFSHPVEQAVLRDMLVVKKR